MSELSSRSGVPVATIKYYLREQVLPAGNREGPTQASYDESHLSRLALVRSLVEVGRVTISGVRELVTALEARTPLGPLLGIAQRLVTTTGQPAREPWPDTVGQVTGADPAGPCAVGVGVAARALEGVAQAGEGPSRAWTEKYWQAAQLMAEADLDELERREGDAERARLVVVGTPMGDVLSAGLRRIAQTQQAMRRYPTPEQATPEQADPDQVDPEQVGAQVPAEGAVR